MAFFYREWVRSVGVAGIGGGVDITVATNGRFQVGLVSRGAVPELGLISAK